ncbi:prolyl hydroxylase family protein [Ramlibacter pallidus]|uniref:2OG-Fe(II) oxygenase n=1 Tax=Ramlibacter pallidus TaxID=2780087 RepID=A0ABR9S3E1_9BURK|nr:2OG-Fe(II) oxygenase [Ramlibacter pallidus]MBE7368010.1 2OG-Fe(II) oxygenase [Ramlibacter pallidus]
MPKFQMEAIGVYTIPGFLSPQECRDLIARSESSGFEGAKISRAGAAVVDERIRNNDRVIEDDAELATNLWTRAAPCMPEQMLGRRLVGLNPRFRYYRYVPGQRFKWHMDGAYDDGNGTRSILTFMVYLNEGYEGGETRFRLTSITPREGLALVFDHEQIHEGAEVLSGAKYVLRSDVLSREGK